MLFLVINVTSLSCSTAKPSGTALRGAVISPQIETSDAQDLPLRTESWRRYDIRTPDEPLEVIAEKYSAGLRGENAATGLYAAVSIDLNSSPWLSWQWSLQTRGDALDVAAFFVGFSVPDDKASAETRRWADEVKTEYGFRPPLRSIAYTYGASIPSGVAETGVFGARDVYFVNLRHRRETDGEPRREWRNIAQDYRDIFGEASPPVSAFAIVGDARRSGVWLSFTVGSFQVASRVDQSVTSASPSVRSAKASPLLWALWVFALLASIATGAWLVRRFNANCSDQANGALSPDPSGAGPAAQ